jgi:hypothetical protein
MGCGEFTDFGRLPEVRIPRNHPIRLALAFVERRHPTRSVGGGATSTGRSRAADQFELGQASQYQRVCRDGSVGITYGSPFTRTQCS